MLHSENIQKTSDGRGFKSLRGRVTYQRCPQCSSTKTAIQTADYSGGGIWHGLVNCVDCGYLYTRTLKTDRFVEETDELDGTKQITTEEGVVEFY